MQWLQQPHWATAALLLEMDHLAPETCGLDPAHRAKWLGQTWFKPCVSGQLAPLHAPPLLTMKGKRKANSSATPPPFLHTLIITSCVKSSEEHSSHLNLFTHPGCHFLAVCEERGYSRPKLFQAISSEVITLLLPISLTNNGFPIKWSWASQTPSIETSIFWKEWGYCRVGARR